MTKIIQRVSWKLLFWLLVSAGCGLGSLALSTAVGYARWVKIILGSALMFIASDIKSRAGAIEAKKGDLVFDYYMHVWKVFYLCYVMLPFIK